MTAHITCPKWVNLEAGTTCQLPADHAGECREITWAELQAVDDGESDDGE